MLGFSPLSASPLSALPYNEFLVVCEPGEIVVSGQYTTLAKGYYSTTNIAAYAVSGANANTEKGYYTSTTDSYLYSGYPGWTLRSLLHNANAGSYSVVGSQANTSKHTVFSANSDSYTISGFQNTLLKGYYSSATGAYSLAGSSANTIKSYRFNIDLGAHIASGSDASLSKGYYVTSDSGQYVVSGNELNVIRIANLSAGDGAFNVVGADTSSNKGMNIALINTSYLITGMPLTIVSEHILPLNPANVSVLGSKIILSVSSILSKYAISAEFYSITGIKDYYIPLNSQPITLGGERLCVDSDINLPKFEQSAEFSDITCLLSYAAQANSGVLSVVGSEAVCIYDRISQLSNTSFYIDSPQVLATKEYLCHAEHASFSLQVKNTNINVTEGLTNVAFNVFGSELTGLLGKVANILPEEISISGNASILAKHTFIPCEAVPYDCVGDHIVYYHDRVCQAYPAEIYVLGSDAKTLSHRINSASQGQAVINGTNATQIYGKAQSLSPWDVQISGKTLGKVKTTISDLEYLRLDILPTPVDTLYGREIKSYPAAHYLTGNDSDKIHSKVLHASSDQIVYLISDIKADLDATMPAMQYTTEVENTTGLKDYYPFLSQGYLNAEFTSASTVFNRISSSISFQCNISGRQATVLKDSIVDTDIGNVFISGGQNTLLKNYGVKFDFGEYIITNFDIPQRYNRITSLQKIDFATLDNYDTTLIKDYTRPGEYYLSGSDATLIASLQSYKINTDYIINFGSKDSVVKYDFLLNTL